MSSRASRAVEIARLEKELQDANYYKEKYRRRLIELDPDYLKKERPTPVAKYSKALIDRVMLMGDQGMAEDQWVAEFGLSRRTWNEWKAQYPELVEAVDRGLQRALAWWHESARHANETGNSKFGMSIYKQRVAEIEGGMTDLAAGDNGDASRLVLLDLREDPEGEIPTPGFNEQDAA